MSGIIAGMSAITYDNDQVLPHERIYQVATPVYEGPLDLLLQLIERAELDITKLSLAQVTDQYLAHIKHLPAIAAEDVSSFLVIAARLLQIKSEVLLPRAPDLEHEEEDPADALARQLRTYKRFKEIAVSLSKRESKGLHAYLRLSPHPNIQSHFKLEELTLDQLIEAIQNVYQQIEKPALGTVVKPPRITIREKIGHISRYLRDHRKVTFRSLLTSGQRLDIVVTFLAMLELIKRRLLLVQQENIFGEIEIEQRGEWDEEEDFELEFGE
jgi:segregation and condensation protein A